MLIERAQKIISPNLKITKCTTPVLYFGNFKSAQACTISLNPSDREFCDKKGKILKGADERLCSRKKIGKKDHECLSVEEAKLVINYCNGYFDKRPYKKWFNAYNEFLRIFGLSYYDGSVVHLDLVQWATTPFWQKLDSSVRQTLLLEDLPFLKKLLRKRFNYIFLNSKTVVNEVSNKLGISLTAQNIVTRNQTKLIMYKGTYATATVVGWSLYLQSAAVGGYSNIQEIAKAVKTTLGGRINPIKNR